MKAIPLALAAASLAPLAFMANASPPPGAYPRAPYVRPVPPIYRPGYLPGYPGWRAGYWGPRGGWYYGGPGYWGAWPYAAAWGYGLGGYAVGYPYVAAPLVINTVTTPQLVVEQAPAPAPQPASYWYYCTQPAGYFPYVKDCSQPWLKVLPQLPGEQVTPPQLAR